MEKAKNSFKILSLLTQDLGPFAEMPLCPGAHEPRLWLRGDAHVQEDPDRGELEQLAGGGVVDGPPLPGQTR